MFAPLLNLRACTFPCEDEAFLFPANLGHLIGGLFVVHQHRPKVAVARNLDYRRKFLRGELRDFGIPIFIIAILLALAVSAALFFQYI
jgi:hypothetical protein